MMSLPVLAGVFPTHVGVFPDRHAIDRECVCLPHARGGVSVSRVTRSELCSSSPRTWGCFPSVVLGFMLYPVFPTHVGVFLMYAHSGSDWRGLPHARGGVSASLVRADDGEPSSPRTWGCFPFTLRLHQGYAVFPTHVGVFPTSSAQSPTRRSLPHARGGVSGCGQFALRCGFGHRKTTTFEHLAAHHNQQGFKPIPRQMAAHRSGKKSLPVACSAYCPCFYDRTFDAK